MVPAKPGPFRIDPVHEEEKVVVITYDIAETYVPVRITTFESIHGAKLAIGGGRSAI
ncbi:MAG: hypothetical protein ACREVV_08055 [Steroidobacteraceae bacterium]